MIDFYAWRTPNAAKVAIFLHESKLPYRLHPVNIGKDEQFNPEFLKISPNNKIPAIVDENGPGDLPVSVFESGAILLYLAEKTKKFIPQEPLRRIVCIEWLMFQMASVGPMLGQLNHFLLFAKEKIPYAIDRYTKEAHRIYRVMDLHLAKSEYFALEYSISDIAVWPWVNAHERQELDISQYPHVLRWYQNIAARPAVKTALERLNDLAESAS